MLRLRVKSSLSALRTASMSALTSSRLMTSSSRVELIFTLAADWPFSLAWKTKRGKEEEENEVREKQRQIKSNQAAHFPASRTAESCSPPLSSLTFRLLGGVEPGAGGGQAGGGGVGRRRTEPGGGHQGGPDLA